MTTRTRLSAAPPATRASRLARLLPVPAGAGMARVGDAVTLPVGAVGRASHSWGGSSD